NSYTYLPFGETQTLTEGVANPFEFVGQFGVMSETTGLHIMRERFYDSQSGRFQSPDPLGLFFSISNLYEYALKEPNQLVDPTGLWYVDIGIAGGVGVGGIGGVQFGPGGWGVYVGGGITTPGLSVGVSVNTGNPTPGNGVQVQGGIGPGV